MMNEFFPAAVSLLVIGGALLFGFVSELRTNHRFRAFRPYPNDIFRNATQNNIEPVSPRLARYARR